MLGDDDDVFDSVTWESPAVQGYDVGGPSSARSGPGFRQSTSESDPGHGPHDPKWEGYLITTVKDPVKELAETKDAYVSYLVTAKVCTYELLLKGFYLSGHMLPPDQSSYLLHAEPLVT